MDRRKRKTRQAIQQACAKLLQQKGFEAMTVQDISDMADIHRGTFYLHFEDKYDMIDQFERELLQKVSDLLVIEEVYVQSTEQLIMTRYEPLVKLFTIFQEEKQLLQILFDIKGLSAMQKSFQQMAYKTFKFNEAQKTDSLPIPPLFFVIVISTMMTIAQYGIESEEDVAPTQLAKQVLSIIVNGPAKAFGLMPGEAVDVTTYLD